GGCPPGTALAHQGRMVSDNRKSNLANPEAPRIERMTELTDPDARVRLVTWPATDRLNRCGKRDIVDCQRLRPKSTMSPLPLRRAKLPTPQMLLCATRYSAVEFQQPIHAAKVSHEKPG